MKYLHFFPVEKFTQKYIEDINATFHVTEHCFILYGKCQGIKLNCFEKNANVIYLSVANIWRMLLFIFKSLINSKKIFLHSLFNSKLVLFFVLQPWFYHKYHWVLWGGDLYNYHDRKKNLKSRFLHIARYVLIKNLRGICFGVKGEFHLAKKWYKTKAKYYDAGYRLWVEDLQEIAENLKIIKGKKEDVYIQIGNSATPTNQHIQILENLKHLRNKNIKIYCPLSYGDQEYALEVLEIGNKIFGDKFIPILDFMKYEEYIKFLNNIDIAIFNLTRQQALGNISTLLYLGKKIYMSDDITPWNHFKKTGIELFSYSQIDWETFLEPLSDLKKEINKTIIENEQNRKIYMKRWKNVFND